MSDAFDDWVQRRSGWEWLNHVTTDPLAEARAFYLPWVMHSLIEQEADARLRQRIKESNALIDDVSSQVRK